MLMVGFTASNPSYPAAFSLAIQKTVNDNYLFHQVCMSNLKLLV